MPVWPLFHPLVAPVGLMVALLVGSTLAIFGGLLLQGFLGLHGTGPARYLVGGRWHSKVALCSLLRRAAQIARPESSVYVRR